MTYDIFRGFFPFGTFLSPPVQLLTLLFPTLWPCYVPERSFALSCCTTRVFLWRASCEFFFSPLLFPCRTKALTQPPVFGSLPAAHTPDVSTCSPLTRVFFPGPVFFPGSFVALQSLDCGFLPPALPFVAIFLRFHPRTFSVDIVAPRRTGLLASAPLPPHESFSGLSMASPNPVPCGPLPLNQERCWRTRFIYFPRLFSPCLCRKISSR